MYLVIIIIIDLL